MYWVTGAIGLILMAAPFIMQYSDNSVALWTSILVGLATVVVSWIEGVRERKENWEYWAAALFGLAAIAAPFALNFSSHATAMWTTVVAGIFIVLFAGSELTTGQWRET